MWSPLRPSPPFEQAAGAWSCRGRRWLTFQTLPGRGRKGSNLVGRRAQRGFERGPRPKILILARDSITRVFLDANTSPGT